jgi:hypothetical protein
MAKRDGDFRVSALLLLNIASDLAKVEPSSFASLEEVGDLGIDLWQRDPVVVEALNNVFDRVEYYVEVGMLFHACC